MANDEHFGGLRLRKQLNKIASGEKKTTTTITTKLSGFYIFNEHLN